MGAAAKSMKCVRLIKRTRSLIDDAEYNLFKRRERGKKIGKLSPPHNTTLQTLLCLMVLVPLLQRLNKSVLFYIKRFNSIGNVIFFHDKKGMMLI